jgi:hypothetical protein
VPPAGERGRGRIAKGTAPARLVTVLVLAAGCAAGPRVAPVPAAGVALDPAGQSATAESDGVQLVVQPSAWRGRPASLPGPVTPFHVLLVNGAAQSLQYDYGDVRLFDDQRFQYTALPPVDVVRLLRFSGPDALIAAAGVTLPHRRRAVGHPLVWDPFWDPWWGRGLWGWPYWPYPEWPPSVEDILAQALPVGPLESGARREGFVYFPRLRAQAHNLSFEMHYRVADAARVFRLPFQVRP